MSTPPQRPIEDIKPDVTTYDGPADDAAWAELDKLVETPGGLDATTGLMPAEEPDDKPGPLAEPKDPHYSDAAGDESGREAKDGAPQGEAEAQEEAEAVDYGVEVPLTIAGQETVKTVGELKDIANGTDEEFRTRQLNLQQRERQFDEFMQVANLTEDQKRGLDGYLQYRKTVIDQNRQSFVWNHREWSDQKMLEQELSGMRETAARYGAPQSWLDTVHEPWVMEMLLDNTRLRADKARAFARVKQVKETPRVPKGQNTLTPGGVTRRDSVDKIFSDAQADGRDHNAEIPDTVWSRLDKLV